MSSNNNTVSNRHGSATITFPNDTDYLVTRAFDAPADLVYKAFTTPDLVKRWWGFETAEWLVCDIDLRVGGKWRYVIKEAHGEVAFNGEFKEIDAPGRLVYTEVYEGAAPDPQPEDYANNIMTLDEEDGVTTMTTLVELPSKEVRDMIIESGMEGGMQVSYDRLEDLVRGLPT